MSLCYQPSKGVRWFVSEVFAQALAETINYMAALPLGRQVALG